MCLTTRPCTIITLRFRGQNNNNIYTEMIVHFVKKLLNLPIQFILGRKTMQKRFNYTVFVYIVLLGLVSLCTICWNCQPLGSKAHIRYVFFFSCYCFAFVGIAHVSAVIHSALRAVSLSIMHHFKLNVIEIPSCLSIEIGRRPILLGHISNRVRDHFSCVDKYNQTTMINCTSDFDLCQIKRTKTHTWTAKFWANCWKNASWHFNKTNKQLANSQVFLMNDEIILLQTKFHGII